MIRPPCVTLNVVVESLILADRTVPMNDLLGIIKDTDIAYSWITALFSNDPGKPLSAAFAAFSSTLTFLGALFMSWHVLTGIVSTAYTGKVLGEKWHQIWAPLRVIFGFGLLVPIGGGFSSVHYLLKDVVGPAAVNLGNAPIVAYITAATSRENISNIRSVYGSNLANEFLKKEICFQVVDYLNNNTIARNRFFGPGVSQPSIEGAKQHFWDSSKIQWDYGACGSVIMSNIETSDSKVEPFDSTFFPDKDDLLNNFNKSRIAATGQLITSIRQSTFIDFAKLAKFLAEHGAWNENATPTKDIVDALVSQGLISPRVISDLKSYGDQWDNSVSTAAQQVFKISVERNGENLKERIFKYGFMVAGSYERSLSSISGAAVSLASSPAIVQPSSLSDAYNQKVEKAYSILSSLISSNDSQALSAGISDATKDTDWVPWLIEKIFPANLSNMMLGKKSVDPVGDMMTLGHSLLNYASIGVGALVAAAFVAGGPSAVTQAPLSAFNMAASFIVPILMAMVLVGVLYAFILPMLPMIMVFAMGISWLILFLEASIAAVLWAFAFIRMDGHEFFDRNQSPGVSLLFNLLLRPALGMLAYCGLLLLQPLLLNSLAEIWNGSFAAQTGELSKVGLAWLWQLIAQLGIFAYLQWHLNLRLAHLIPSIPDRVGHWMGIQMHGYNESGESRDLMALGVGLGAMSQRGVGNVIQAVSRYSDMKEREQQNGARQFSGGNPGVAHGGGNQEGPASHSQHQEEGKGGGSGNGPSSGTAAQEGASSSNVGGITSSGSVRGSGIPNPQKGED